MNYKGVIKYRAFLYGEFLEDFNSLQEAVEHFNKTFLEDFGHYKIEIVITNI